MQLFYHTHKEAGTDEAGRGCLAGPVTAAAVILPENFKNELLTDSKQLTEKQRLILRTVIEQQAVAFAVAHVFPVEIDELNILRASILAMHRALEQLSQTPDFIAVDGNKFVKYGTIPHACIVKGDAKIQTIAAASVLAKTYRDAYMERIADEYPMYQWKKNKGYPTVEHRRAIQEYGITPYHRKSFQLLPVQMKLEF
ncbi:MULTISPECIES: ribonuclease HII [Capnocytophaga]|uniref:Ribonuclease HII n=1 Tax=Capnocytophaga canis TaxID=1848903 RepID=A0A0B7I7Y4_9FLAO|nr:MULTISPECIES: ribonuclease HII [Capnocytophaga]ATA72698.1 ribonuclease HII [Capnocytophaga sp. H4358]RIY36267.1 ribonuclease HII [Capnocytophaga canis]CEN48081.1 Ribonuclease HII [Capnocytophaga canis]CEN53824.1 Ribonuclease HII [Capnocytophaga canis]